MGRGSVLGRNDMSHKMLLYDELERREGKCKKNL